MCVFIISPVPIAEPLTSEFIDTPVFYNSAPRPIKYRVSVPIPSKVASELFMTECQGWKEYYRFEHKYWNNCRLTNFVHLNTNN